MYNFDKEEIEKMAASGDKKDLRLHWESDDCEAEETTAQGILDTIKEKAAEGTHDERWLWDIAYICTEEDYQEEKNLGD